MRHRQLWEQQVRGNVRHTHIHAYTYTHSRTLSQCTSAFTRHSVHTLSHTLRETCCVTYSAIIYIKLLTFYVDFLKVPLRERPQQAARQSLLHQPLATTLFSQLALCCLLQHNSNQPHQLELPVAMPTTAVRLDCLSLLASLLERVC